MSNVNQNKPASRESARTARQRGEDGDREAVAMPSNTATNNSINEGLIKFLRFGVDSLYISYQGELFDSVDEKLGKLKLFARSESQDQQAKAQYKIGDHLFEVKDKGTSMFAYILEDNAFRIHYHALRNLCRWHTLRFQANTSPTKHQPMQKSAFIAFSLN